MPSHKALFAALLLVLLASAQCQQAKVKSAKFVTCPGCRLNHLPDVKKFIKGEIEAGKYPGVTVEFIPGRVPELFLFDEQGQEVQRMFVDKLSFADLSNLMNSHGFTRKGDE